ncbi:unnamed protein product, partial [Iphiclides podalirius]
MRFRIALIKNGNTLERYVGWSPLDGRIVKAGYADMSGNEYRANEHSCPMLSRNIRAAETAHLARERGGAGRGAYIKIAPYGGRVLIYTLTKTDKPI